MIWRLKIYLFIVSVMFFTFGCDRERARVESQDEVEIKNKSEAYSEAYNNKDIDKLSSLFSQDAVYTILSTQRVIEGRDEIAKYFKELLSNENSSLKIMITSIDSKGLGKASVDGFAQISYKDKQEKYAYKIDYIKENNSWFFQKISVLELPSPPSHYDHLKELEWLVGQWVDNDENIEMTLTCKWGKNNNFLIQSFTTKVLNQEIIEGEQMITWDPSDNRIRSWVFDSDGGFGESFWFQQDNSWYTTMSFVLPDGRKASAIHIYTKIDNNTYTFASVSRDIDGKMLPDIGPFEVIRKQ